MSLEWSDGKLSRRMEKLAIWTCVLITVVLHLVVHIPQRWLDSGWRYPGSPKRINLDKAAARYGWKELGQKVYDVKNEMRSAQSSKQGVFIISDQYGLSSSIAFYTPDQMETHLWTWRKVHGENYRFWDDYPSKKQQDAIFVTKSEKNSQNFIPWLQDHFEETGKPEPLPILHQGKIIRYFYIVRCFKFKGIAPDFQK
jgi:hypothetical protein